MWDGCVRSLFWYDKAGRTWKEQRTLDGHTYETSRTYDAMDRVYQMTYPDSEVLTYSYAGNGLLGGIASAVGPATYLSNVAYNALNSPASYTLGSGATALATHTYYGPDATGYPYGALKTIRLQQGTNPMLVDRDITYDPVGNVMGINDLVNSENISYTYDYLDRLTGASAPSGESYAYNEIGNIASKTSVPFTHDANHKHAAGSYNGTSYGYDANGSMTTRGSQAIRYDKQCRPVRVDSGGSTVCRFAYDGDGVRRKRLDASGTIHYVGPYERNLGNGWDTAEVVTKFYSAALGGMSRLIGFRKAGTLYYVGTDHLGGTIRVIDSSFNAVDGQRYRPFGGDRDAVTDLETDHKFTNQIEDASIGLYWYGFRAYDPAIGRFVAPDTIVPSAGNPQALNRYSYTFNNPLRYIDPSGHDPEGWFDDSWQQEFRDAHGGADPTLDDLVYRYLSKAAASGMLGDDGVTPSYAVAPSAGGVEIGATYTFAGSSTLAGPTLPGDWWAGSGGILSNVGTWGGGLALSGGAIAYGGTFSVMYVEDASGGAAIVISLGGGGMATVGNLSLSGTYQSTNATSVDQLRGWSGQTGGSAGELWGGGAEVVTMDGVIGVDVNVGATLSAIPVEMQGFMVHSWVFRLR